jgi:hypothetical protein
MNNTQRLYLIKAAGTAQPQYGSIMDMAKATGLKGQQLLNKWTVYGMQQKANQLPMQTTRNGNTITSSGSGTFRFGQLVPNQQSSSAPGTGLPGNNPFTSATPAPQAAPPTTPAAPPPASPAPQAAPAPQQSSPQQAAPQQSSPQQAAPQYGSVRDMAKATGLRGGDLLNKWNAYENSQKVRNLQNATTTSSTGPGGTVSTRTTGFIPPSY